MLSLVDFSVSVGEKHILAPLSFDFVSGRIYAFLGENGSGKSSFAFGLFGHPKYQTEGKISYHDEDISHASPDILSEK
jgi:Fe-S cluster assembly ATP-binding protein